MGPTFNFNKKKLIKQKQLNQFRRTEGQTVRKNFKFLFLFSFLSQIYGNLTVGFRRVKHEKCSTRRELRVGNKNTGFHQEFR